MELDPDQLRFSIERFRDQNINDKAYQKELINAFIKAVYVYDDRLKIVMNRGPNDDVEVPFEEIAAYEGDGEEASCVRINEDKAYQTIPVRTPPITILARGFFFLPSWPSAICMIIPSFVFLLRFDQKIIQDALLSCAE